MRGCTGFSKLTFLVELFQLKVRGKWSDKSFTTLLDFLRRSAGEREGKEMEDEHELIIARAISGTLFSVLGAASFALLWLVNWRPGHVYSNIFEQDHSGRVRCLRAGALPCQVFPDQFMPRLFLTQINLHTSDEEQKQEKMERMRQMHEHQLQSFTRVIQSIMISENAGGSREPELLPTQMAVIMTDDIMQQQTNTSQNARGSRKSPSVSKSDSD